ncbi:MAG: Imm10 family immunity protein [Saprospiraceae bacterium]
MKFHATNIEYWSQNQVETVFFGNEEKGLALLISSVAGTADHYLEWNDQSNTCVNGVERIELSTDALLVQLSPPAAEQLGEAAFEVEFACEEELFTAIARCLKLVFADKLLVKQPVAQQNKTAPKQDYSKVKYLNLEGKKLAQLPDYVAEMSALETVKLSVGPETDFHAVCEVLAQLPGVKHLSLAMEGGAIPESFGKLTRLETLRLSGLTKPCAFPDSVGQLQQLLSLLVLSDSDVVLPESFAELTALQELNMRAASWQLPSQFYRLTRLKTLDFTNCRLQRVPEEMTQMTALETVIFCSPEERDYAQILSVIARMPSVKVLEMSVNPVPEAIGLCQNIEEFVVWGSSDRDHPLQLPDAFFGLSRLRSLSLNMCYLEKIPEEIGRLKGLRDLSFMESEFERLPDSIGELSGLEGLNINQNPALSTLPASLALLTQLSDLYLDGNPLLSELPPGLDKLANLKNVRLSNRERVNNVPAVWNELFTAV